MTFRCSVDINLRTPALSGWASCAQPVRAELHHHDQFLGAVPCTLNRSDVLAARLHETGRCGFAFHAAEYGIAPGNIYKVVLRTTDGQREFLRLYGDHTALLNTFIHFELLPRDDPQYLRASTEQILAKGSDLEAYKSLMIRLRRGKRGQGWRGRFSGIDYEAKDSDLAAFTAFTERYLSVLLGFLDARYLWSILDTLADYGPQEQRLAALAASNFLTAEKMQQTRSCLFVSQSRPAAECVTTHQLLYWGGMKTFQLSTDDALDIFLTRNIELLSGFPVVAALFFELLKRAARTSDSGLGFNLGNSRYMQEAFDFYEKSRLI
ncbi:hypothetical protein [Pseudomonas tohonis]|uniref:hypothetical protein n=1 Tax=Pseudomonas tohonis TaxID=2725477 RepID=UPI001F328BF3|nr:hypothetical protein [Pseudomonas tohonis]